MDRNEFALAGGFAIIISLAIIFGVLASNHTSAETATWTGAIGTIAGVWAAAWAVFRSETTAASRALQTAKNADERLVENAHMLVFEVRSFLADLPNNLDDHPLMGTKIHGESHKALVLVGLLDKLEVLALPDFLMGRYAIRVSHQLRHISDGLANPGPLLVGPKGRPIRLGSWKDAINKLGASAYDDCQSFIDQVVAWEKQRAL